MSEKSRAQKAESRNGESGDRGQMSEAGSRKSGIGDQAPLLEINELSTWFPIRRGIFSRTVGHVRAVDGVSLSMAPGETLGLVGESGCGKSTLARSILLLDKAHEGSIHFDGVDLLASSRSVIQPLRRRFQVIFQDPFASLNPRMTVLDIVSEGLIEHGVIRRHERADATMQLLDDVGLGPDALHRYPHEFSGGQRQRISIARAISLHPDLIICDEAVSALDVSIQAQVMNLLIDLRKKYNLAYLFISHDLSVVRHISDRIAVMYLGRVVESGKTEDIMARPRHPYTKALISAIPRAGEPKQERIVLPGDVPSPANPPPGCPFHPRCPHATEICAQERPILGHLADDTSTRRVACHLKEQL
jgi:oligopeptide/dipeptide ABC transporter ATP-binding protein